MCQSLVDKVAQSRQLMAVAHPEVLGLFEDWLEELEDEVVRLAAKGPLNARTLAGTTGLSQAGAEFILTKLRREQRME